MNETSFYLKTHLKNYNLQEKKRIRPTWPKGQMLGQLRY